MKLFYKLVPVCFTAVLLISPQNLFSQTRGFFKVADTLDEKVPELGTYYALLIASQDYLDPNINQLTEPINDATKLKDVLQKQYGFKDENIIFLKNPKRSDIYAALEGLVDK